jgi:hypothetical protein
MSAEARFAASIISNIPSDYEFGKVETINTYSSDRLFVRRLKFTVTVF